MREHKGKVKGDDEKEQAGCERALGEGEWWGRGRESMSGMTL